MNSSQSHCLPVLAALTIVQPSVGDAPATRVAPELQRIIVLERHAYCFREEPRALTTPAPLVEYDWHSNDSPRAVREYYLEDVWTQVRMPMAWTISGGAVHTILDYGVLTGMRHWPIAALVPGKNRRHPLGLEKVPFGPARPTVHTVRPILSLASGRYALTETGLDTHSTDASAAGSYRDVFVDLRPLEEGAFELFVAVEGRLSVWSGNNEDWQFMRIVPTPVKKPFLVFDDGRRLVTERNGDWCIIGPLEAAEPEARPIIAKDANKPLILVEDVVAKRNYFRMGDNLMDDRGMVLERLDTSEPLEDQMREVVYKVVLRRGDR